MKYKGKTEEQRLLNSISINPITTCWDWTGCKTIGGYGRTNRDLAHRIIYTKFKEPIKEGYWIDHVCKNRGCVNPEHLRQVTPRENALYNSNSVYAKNHAKTHCKWGHEFNKANTWLKPRKTKNGLRTGRECRICKRLRERCKK